MEIQVTSGREAVYETCRAVLEHGHDVAGTRELLGFAIEVSDPTDTLATGIGHVDFRPELAEAEARYLVLGRPYDEDIWRLTDDLESRRWRQQPDLNYGVRLRGQMDAIALKLREEPDTRQAVGLVWRPRDLESGLASFLCATEVQFLRRRGELHMIVTMRSNDAWHGLPYNLHQWASVQGALALYLGTGIGTYRHQVGSMHLYERHWAKAASLRKGAE